MNNLNAERKKGNNAKISPEIISLPCAITLLSRCGQCLFHIMCSAWMLLSGNIFHINHPSCSFLSNCLSDDDSGSMLFKLELRNLHPEIVTEALMQRCQVVLLCKYISSAVFFCSRSRDLLFLSPSVFLLCKRDATERDEELLNTRLLCFKLWRGKLEAKRNLFQGVNT